VTSLIKVLMMLKERNIPPQPNAPFKINRNFLALDKLNVRIAGQGMTLKPRSGGDGRIRVLLNSFDASVSLKHLDLGNKSANLSPGRQHIVNY
jgi:hypothetical protein